VRFPVSLPIITPGQAKRLASEGATIIDVRDAEEFAREHIPGARNVPLSVLAKLDGLRGPILFHCRAGRRTADNAAKLAEAAGCEAYIVEGGIEGWKQAGLPVAIDRSRPIEMNRQVMIAAGSIVLVGVLLGALLAPQFYALSGLIGAGLIFAGLSGWCGMARLLALMPWNRRGVTA